VPNIEQFVPHCELFTEQWDGDRRIRANDVDAEVDGDCLPLPVPGETVLSRWMATKAILTAGDGSGSLTIEGEMALLVTDTCIRGSVVEGVSREHGELWAGLNAFRRKKARTIVFVWTYGEIDVVGSSSDIGQKVAFLRGRHGTLRCHEIAGAKENWMVKGIGYRNRTQEFARQMAAAVGTARGLEVSWKEDRDLITVDRTATFVDPKGNAG
jgi:hypothetical protein